MIETLLRSHAGMHSYTEPLSMCGPRVYVCDELNRHAIFVAHEDT